MDDLKLADNPASTRNVFVRRTKMLIPESRIEIKIGAMIFYPGEMKPVHHDASISLTKRESGLMQLKKKL